MHDTLWSSSLEKLTWIFRLGQTEVVGNDKADSLAGSAILDNIRPLSISHTTSILPEKTMYAGGGLLNTLLPAANTTSNEFQVGTISMPTLRWLLATRCV